MDSWERYFLILYKAFASMSTHSQNCQTRHLDCVLTQRAWFPKRVREWRWCSLKTAVPWPNYQEFSLFIIEFQLMISHPHPDIRNWSVHWLSLHHPVTYKMPAGRKDTTAYHLCNPEPLEGASSPHEKAGKHTISKVSVPSSYPEELLLFLETDWIFSYLFFIFLLFTMIVV